MKKVFGFLLLLFFLSGCKKEKLNIPFSEIEISSDLDLYQLQSHNHQTIFLCGGKQNSGVIFKSVDAGKNWSTLATFNRNVYSVFFVNDLVGFAGSDSSTIFKTTDGGISWNQYIDYSGVPQLNQVPLRSFCFINDTVGFVCGGKGFGKGIIYQTNDQGNNWTKTLTDHEMRSIAFNASGNVLCVGYGAMYIYLTGWSLVGDVAGEFYTGVAYDNRFFSCGFNGGIYKSDNGTNWSCIDKPNKSYSARQHYNSITSKGSTVFNAGINGMCAYSKNGGSSFEKGECFGGTHVNSVILLSGNRGLAAGNKGKLFEFEL